MIAVIFEVEPRDGQMQAYLDHAADLRPVFEVMEGFISVERFESLTTPGKYLSLSFWESEEAVARWRGTEAHRDAQRMGRAEYFNGYRLRVAGVLRDYGMDRREGVPADSASVHG